MKLHALQMPEEPTELAAWLEQQLTGITLGELLVELTAIRGERSPAPADLDQWLGKQRALVLREGLTALPPESVQKLLQQPELLLELQELVLLEGGPHWQGLVSGDDSAAAAFAQGRDRLSAALGPLAGAVVSLPRARMRWYQRPAIVSLATAACALVAVTIFDRSREQAVAPSPAALAWGWSAHHPATPDATAAEYLQQLAKGADAWFNKRPTDRQEVAQRILEMRAGCSRLLLAEHQPLSPRDREWLSERCRRWAARFNEQLAAIERGDDPLQVRSDMDETVKRIVTTLEDRARRSATT